MWLYVNSFRLSCVRACVLVCVRACVWGCTYLGETMSWNVVKCMSWNNKEEIETTCTVQQ